MKNFLQFFRYKIRLAFEGRHEGISLRQVPRDFRNAKVESRIRNESAIPDGVIDKQLCSSFK